MPHFDLPLADLQSYSPAIARPADFDAFWRDTLAEADRHSVNAKFSEADPNLPLRLVDVHDVTFAGYGGHPIKAWLLLPKAASTAGDKLPCLVTFVGYGGGRGLPIDHLAPAAAGLAHFVMDTRGQGSGWSPGATPDPVGRGPHAAGFMTAGIESRESYYYRRVFVDAVRAVQAATSHPRIDPQRIAVGGSSQGGGIALATAGLLGERVRALLADVPFLCHFRRATTIIETHPYAEIGAYLRVHRDRTESVFDTLAYFDGANFAPGVRAATLFSCGLMDNVCPPSTVFAAYNRIAAPKEMRVFDFNQHEGGGSQHATERLRFLQQRL
jgi:cephalosporin-C deacetylase